jgi:ubiquinol-cytochrome c reductase iron-sulfur subunit
VSTEDDPGEDLRVVSQRIPAETEANDTVVVGAALVAGLGGVVFGVGWLAGWSLGVIGTGAGVGLLALGVALRRYVVERFPDVEAVEPRPEADRFEQPRIADVPTVPRRRLLGRLISGAAGVMGLGFLTPVVSLGPSPGPALTRTSWADGVRLVTSNGQPVRPEDIAAGGVSTVWPADNVGDEIAAALLLRPAVDPAAPTNLDWVVDGNLLAYSKVCTHAGCPVALFRESDEALFCPCHQSTFDVTAGARPTFGPAARSLPQLPLGVDDEGWLVARGDFPEPVGPPVG